MTTFLLFGDRDLRMDGDAFGGAALRFQGFPGGAVVQFVKFGTAYMTFCFLMNAEPANRSCGGGSCGSGKGRGDTEGQRIKVLSAQQDAENGQVVQNVCRSNPGGKAACNGRAC